MYLLVTAEEGHILPATLQGDRHYPKVGLVSCFTGCARLAVGRSWTSCAASLRSTNASSAGRKRNKHEHKKSQGWTRLGWQDCRKIGTPAPAMAETIAMPLVDTSAASLQQAIHDNVEVGSTLFHRRGYGLSGIGWIVLPAPDGQPHGGNMFGRVPLPRTVLKASGRFSSAACTASRTRSAKSILPSTLTSSPSGWNRGQR